MYEEMVSVLSSQALILEELGEKSAAGGLWLKAAKISEENLSDTKGAIEAYTKAENLNSTVSAMDALARLYTASGDFEQSVVWLKKRLEHAEADEKAPLLLKLARIRLRLKDDINAVEVLEQAFKEAPRNAEVRRLLFEKYREQEQHDKLASALESAVFSINDTRSILAYAKEAAHIYFEKLNLKKEALSVLTKTAELDPADLNSKIMLAEALADSGRLEEAQQILLKLLEGFGRRRSPLRASVHLKLANVVKALGDNDAALAQLELAAKIDSNNAGVLETLAKLAKEKNDLDLADKTYRSLLMIARRRQDNRKLSTGPSIILLELSDIAQLKGQKEKAAELAESALDALSADDSQAEGIKQKLAQDENWELWLKVLKVRLSYLTSPRIRAKVMSELAQVYQDIFDNKDEAFIYCLKAVKEDPGSPVYHDAAEALAKELDRYEEYIKEVESLMSLSRRETDVLMRCELLLRMAKINIGQKVDLDAAWQLFKQAESLGVREVDVLRVGAKLAGASGNEEEQVRLLNALSNMGEREIATNDRADAMFRLAEIYMGAEETFEEGLSRFIEAFNESENCERAGRILRRSVKTSDANSRLLKIYEKVARKSPDKTLLLDYYELKASLPDATPSLLLEGARLALELKRIERAD
jgi:tetratricopeptide (TPR) repeat protein